MEAKKTVNSEMAKLEPLGNHKPWKNIISGTFDFNSHDKIQQLGQDLAEFVRFILEYVVHHIDHRHYLKHLTRDSDRDLYATKIAENLVSRTASQIKQMFNSYDEFANMVL